MNRPGDERKIRRKVKEMNELKEGLTNRACTKKIIVGSVEIGGGTSVKIQSMTTTKTSDVAATVRQIEALKEAGCEIVRVAVADEDDAAAVKAVKEKISLPLVADIHFSPKLAVAAIENGADKVRINPGNIGGEKEIKYVADCIRAHKISVQMCIRDRHGRLYPPGKGRAGKFYADHDGRGGRGGKDGNDRLRNTLRRDEARRVQIRIQINR